MARLSESGTANTRLSNGSPYPPRPATDTGDERRFTGRVRPRIQLLLMVLGLWAFGSWPAHAALIYVTPTVSFSDSVSVTDDESAGDTSNDGADLGSSLLEQFDATLGVLMDATLNLVSTRDQSLTVSSTAGTPGGGPPGGGPPGGGPGGNNVTSSGSGSSTANISAPGIDYTFSTAIAANGDCTDKPWKACSNTTLAAGVATDQNIAASASLDSYVYTGSGTGMVTVSRTAQTLSASQGAGVFDGDETTQYDLTWAGDISVTYSYLLHAAPSFDSGAPNDTLVLDFGTVTQGSAVSPLGFSLFNLADSERVALDLDSFSLTGGSDTGALDTNLAIFTALTQGGEQAFQASFDTANVGSFLETFTLILSDADVGAAASRSTYSLTLTLQGEVIAAPLPDAVWLFGSGLIGLVGIARRTSS